MHRACAYRLLASIQISDDSVKGVCPGCHEPWLVDIDQFTDRGRIYRRDDSYSICLKNRTHMSSIVQILNNFVLYYLFSIWRVPTPGLIKAIGNIERRSLPEDIELLIVINIIEYII